MALVITAHTTDAELAEANIRELKSALVEQGFKPKVLNVREGRLRYFATLRRNKLAGSNKSEPGGVEIVASNGNDDDRDPDLTKISLTLTDEEVWVTLKALTSFPLTDVGLRAVRAGVVQRLLELISK